MLCASLRTNFSGAARAIARDAVRDSLRDSSIDSRCAESGDCFLVMDVAEKDSPAADRQASCVACGRLNAARLDNRLVRMLPQIRLNHRRIRGCLLHPSPVLSGVSSLASNGGNEGKRDHQSRETEQRKPSFCDVCGNYRVNTHANRAGVGRFTLALRWAGSSVGRAGDF